MRAMREDEVTELLRKASAGDTSAIDRLMPHIYDELRARAGAFLRKERPDHTLQTTALVHEAYLRLIDQENVEWSDRAHFFAIAATCIRRILVDHARKRHAKKRDASAGRVPLEKIDVAVRTPPAELLALDAALGRLAEQDERKARVVELRFFGGLRNEEVGELLGVSLGTVERDLRLARAWLHRELTRPAP